MYKLIEANASLAGVEWRVHVGTNSVQRQDATGKVVTTKTCI